MNKLKDWRSLKGKAYVAYHRYLEQQDRFWTPIGTMNETFVDFCKKKNILQDSPLPRYFVWTYEGKKLFYKLKGTTYKFYIKSMKTTQILSDVDYIAIAISKKMPIPEKGGVNPHEYIKQIRRIEPTEEEKKIAREFNKIERELNEK